MMCIRTACPLGQYPMAHIYAVHFIISSLAWMHLFRFFDSVNIPVNMLQLKEIDYFFMCFYNASFNK